MDWDQTRSYLPPSIDSEALSLYDHTIESLEEALPTKCHLVGYSLGGRVAISLVHRLPHRFAGATILSANPGIECAVEKRERALMEQGWIDAMERDGMRTFIDRWYAHEMFSGLTIPSWRYATSLEQQKQLLQNFSIAKQPSFWNDLPLFQCPLHFMVGEMDQKYLSIAKRLDAMGVSTSIVQGCSHAIHLQQPQRVAEQIVIQHRSHHGNS